MVVDTARSKAYHRAPVATTEENQIGRVQDTPGSELPDAAGPVVSIIIVNWNSQAFVRNCMKSIVSLMATLSYEVIVVDNASFDGCDRMLIAEFPGTTFLQCDHNSGFAQANNTALFQASGRYIMFLNPDTEIVGTAIQTMVNALDTLPDCGMVGARLLNTDLTLQTTCVTSIPTILNQSLASNYLRELFPSWSIWGMQSLYRQAIEPVKVQAISGACMLLREDALRRVGGFTLAYFMYAEDMDLCLKIRQAGWNVYYAPDAVIVHHGGGSSASQDDCNFSSITQRQSLFQFFLAHRGGAYAKSYRGVTALIAASRLFLLILSSPVGVFSKRWIAWRRAMGKWWDILRWSLGRVQQGPSSTVRQPAPNSQHLREPGMKMTMPKPDLVRPQQTKQEPGGVPAS